jgi:hypothetical protein
MLEQHTNPLYGQEGVALRVRRRHRKIIKDDALFACTIIFNIFMV